MGGAADGFASVVTAILLAALAGVLIVLISVSGIMARAVRTGRRNLPLVFVLALAGIVSAEIAAVTAVMTTFDETDSAWAALLFGALSIACFAAIAKRPTRTA